MTDHTESSPGKPVPESGAEPVGSHGGQARNWSKLGIACSWSVYLAGVAWRYYHCFYAHPAKDFIYKSMSAYVRRAQRMWDPNYHQSVGDIIFPPGGHAHIGLTYFFQTKPYSNDPAMVVQYVQSILLPLIIAAIGYELYGRRVALIALVISSIYYPFIDYAAYFMTEGPYMFYLTLSMWFVFRSLRARTKTLGLLFALLAGLSLGVAVSLKTVVLFCGALIFLHLATIAFRTKSRQVYVFLAGSAAGLLFVILPLMARSTRINDGHFVPISTNGALTVLQGHYGDVLKFEFKDKKRGGRGAWFGSPAAHQRGFRRKVTLPYGPWDSPEMLRDAWRWSSANPKTAFYYSCRNVLDLFYGSLAFPSVEKPKWRPWMYWSQRFYWVFILLPSLIHLGFNRRRLSDKQGPGLGDALLLLPLLGLIVVAFFTIGQPRYRIPFDTLQIVLAAQLFAAGRTRSDGLVPWDQRKQDSEQEQETGESSSDPVAVASGEGAKPRGRWRERNVGLAAMAAFALILLVFSGPDKPEQKKPRRVQRPLKISSERILKGHESYVTGVCFSPDSKLIASSSNDQTVRLWNVKTGEMVKTLEGHEQYVRAVSFSPDGKLLASCSNDGTIRLWDVTEGRSLAVLPGHDGPVRSVVFSPDGRLLASGGKDKTVRIWDVEQRALKKTLDGHAQWVNDVDFSPDGKWLVSVGRGGRMIVWDVKTLDVEKLIAKAHATHIYSVTISRAGSMVASTGMDKVVRVRRLPAGKRKCKFNRHTGYVEAAHFAPDGRMLATGGRDEKIMLWDVKAEERLRAISTKMGRITSVYFSPDGRRLAAAGQDGTVRIWRLSK